VRWTVHGERSIYTSDWVGLSLVDIEVPDGPRFEHHVVRFARSAAGVVVHHPDRGVLLLWRHRFITDRWGWEIPGGGVEAGEEPAAAARRELTEETGYVVDRLEPLLSYHPSNGTTDQLFHIFLGFESQRVAEPTDPGESERIEWLPVDRLLPEIEAGRMVDGLGLTALLYALVQGRLG